MSSVLVRLLDRIRGGVTESAASVGAESCRVGVSVVVAFVLATGVQQMDLVEDQSPVE